MWTQFLLENARFAINVFAGYVFFVIFWLYFDAWVDKKIREAPKILGFLLISFSFLISALIVDGEILITPFVNRELLSLVALFIRVLGFTLLFIGLVFEPLQQHPKTEKIAAFSVLSAKGIFLIFLPLVSFLVGCLYLRRATFGLERHLLQLAIGILFISLSSLVGISSSVRNTTDINIFNLVVAFGPLWIIEQILLLLGVLIMGMWAWRYLLKRFTVQLFMIIVGISLIIFLVTTLGFSTLLLKNLQKESLSQLETDVKVLNFAIESKKQELISNAQALSLDGRVLRAIEENDNLNLARTAQDFLLAKKLSTLEIVDKDGKVLARGEDIERVGDSLSNEPLIFRSLLGESLVTVKVKDAVLAPQTQMRSAVAIKKDGEIIGAVLLGVVLDNTFLDGLKKATGLDASLYGDNVLTSTTLVSPDGKSRRVGTFEESKIIKETVLEKGENYTGSVDILSTPYFAAYLPLKDIDNVTVGMLFVGKEQVAILQTASRAIEATFLIAIVFIITSIAPSYLIARHIAHQVR